MNKMIKGTIAIAAAVTLLVGGGGTLASWNADDVMAPGVINAGYIGLEAGDGVWRDKNNVVIDDIAAYQVVPGDKLTYTQSLDIDVEGNNAAAELFVTGGFTSTFAGGDLILSGSLIDNKSGTVIYQDGGTLHDSNYALEESVKLRHSADVTGTLAFEFPWEATGSADADFTFDNIEFILKQIPIESLTAPAVGS